MDILPVGGWQVVQAADGGLTILLSNVRDGLSDEALTEQVTQALVAEGIRDPRVTVQRVPSIPKNASGKTPLIKAYRASTQSK